MFLLYYLNKGYAYSKELIYYNFLATFEGIRQDFDARVVKKLYKLIFEGITREALLIRQPLSTKIANNTSETSN